MSDAGITEHSNDMKNDADWLLDQNEFRFFFNKKLMAEYKKFQEAHFDLLNMLIMFGICMIFFFGRCNILSLTSDGVFFFCSFTLCSVSLCMFLVILAATSLKKLCYTSWLSNELSSFLMKDGCAIIGTIGIGFGLFARVYNGPCDENVTLWDTQKCNPSGNSYTLPTEHVMFLLILPLHCQAVINGLTFQSTCICWFIAVSSIIFSLIQIDSKLDIWIVHLSFLILGISYKFEKLARLTFAHNKKRSNAEEEKMIYHLLQQKTEHQLILEKNKHELEILSIKNEEECRLIAKEKKLMVALIGNVAHDLKTPLQSFLMDLESLKHDPGFKKSKCIVIFFL